MTENLWTAFEAAAATGGALCSRGGDPDRWEAEEWAACGIAIDSRALKPGEIFVALNDIRDGHDFVDNAFEAGASAALVTKPPANAPDGKPFLVVRDTLEGLRDLARAARLRNFGKRIAVTGSAGKTSTKDMLRTMLRNRIGLDKREEWNELTETTTVKNIVHAADRSFNNHFGVPLSLARMPMNAKFGVFEIGMNHAGEITPLVDLVRPHAAIITTVAAAHLEFFNSVEEIAEAKAEIFSGIRQDGTALIPRDNDHYDLLRHRAEHSRAGKVLSFGRHADADGQLLSCKPNSNADGQIIHARLGSDEVEFTLGAQGEHQAMNAIASLLAALSVGAPVEPMLSALTDFNAGGGRGERIGLSLPDARGKITLVDESYNANPASMSAAIGLIGGMKTENPRARRIAVLGQMLELGQRSSELHAGLLDPLLSSKIDEVFVIGEQMNHLWDMLPPAMRGGRAHDPDTLVKMLNDHLHDGDIIMVKGSNASKVSEIVGALKTLCGAGQTASQP